MAADEQAAVARFHPTAEQVEHVVADDGVEACGRLVHHKAGGARCDGGRELELHAHAAAQLLDGPLAVERQVERRAGSRKEDMVERGESESVHPLDVGCGHFRGVGAHGTYRAELGRALDAAGVGRERSQRHSHEGGFPGSVAPDEAHDAAARDLKRDAGDVKTVEVLRYVNQLQVKWRVCHAAHFSSSWMSSISRNSSSERPQARASQTARAREASTRRRRSSRRRSRFCSATKHPLPGMVVT